MNLWIQCVILSTATVPKPKLFRELNTALVPKKISTVPITSNLRIIHGALNAIEKITNYKV